MNDILIFQKTRDHYLSNADETIEKKEYRKASELLWGGVTQQVKFLAASKNIRIRSHTDFRNFIRALSIELKDPGTYDLFITIEQLHRNFYDEIIPEEDFPLYYKKVYLLIKKLNEIMNIK